MSLMCRFARDEAGATAIEYALIIVCIATAIIGGASVLGPKVNNTLLNAGNGFNTPSS